MRKSDVDYLLYAVTDEACHPGMSLLEASRAALAGGTSVLQLRDKHRCGEALKSEAEALAALCRKFNACFIVNDDIEVAAAVHADGVHVGQEDGSPQEARRMLGDDRIVGVSVQTLEQALAAEAAGADYLGVGAMFPTPTKPDAIWVPVETLREITQAVRIPVVIIGGIKLDNLEQFRGCGIDGAAIVSAIFAAQDIESAARKLREKLEFVTGRSAQ